MPVAVGTTTETFFVIIIRRGLAFLLPFGLIQVGVVMVGTCTPV